MKKLFITDELLNKHSQPTYTKDLDIIELRAFIGLLYLSEAMKSAHEDVVSLFASDSTGRDLFQATMSIS